MLKIVLHLKLVDVMHLRATCKQMYSGIDPVPTLSFASYRDSGSADKNLNKSLCKAHKMKLSLDDLCDESFIYLANHKYEHEPVRCIQSHKAHMVSMEA